MKPWGSLGCSDHESVEFRILRERRHIAGLQPQLEESTLWPVQGPAQKNPMGYGPEQKTGPGALADFQGFPPPDSRMVHPNRNSSKSGKRPAQMKKELLTKLIHEKAAYERWQQGQMTQEEYRDTLSMQGQGQESQSLPQSETGEVHEWQQGLLQVYQQQEEDYRKYEPSTEKVTKDMVKDELCLSLYW